jgi:hypothetical protein
MKGPAMASPNRARASALEKKKPEIRQAASKTRLITGSANRQCPYRRRSRYSFGTSLYLLGAKTSIGSTNRAEWKVAISIIIEKAIAKAP